MTKKRWFTSDLHFDHRNVIEYCNRPYASVSEMNKAIIKQWNSQVGPDDVVWVLGDFGINKRKVFDKNLVGKLNGELHIIVGNHDAGFVSLHEGRKFESTCNKYYEAGWASVRTFYKDFELKDGTKVQMAHIPPTSADDNRYSQFKLGYHKHLNYVHGHLHGKYRKKDNCVDVSFDGDLTLLSEDQLIELVNSEESFIPTRLTNKYSEEMPLNLMPFEEEVKNKFVRKVMNDDFSLVLYNYTEHCTFERAWNEVTRHSRGIIFDRTNGNIVALPFPKFFNLGEMPETRLENLPDEPYTVTDKMDGSLGIVYYWNNDWHVATRGSFNSEQAKQGRVLLNKYRTDLMNKNYTYLVEIVYPENKIVADYGDREELVLLSIVNVPKQVEASRKTVEDLGGLYGFPVVEQYNHSIEEMVELQKTLPKDKEGFVVRFESGLRVKIKGAEYCRIHKMISHMTPIAFWETMENGKVSIDYLEELPEEYRKEADELTEQLELNYHKAKEQVLATVDQCLRTVGFGSMQDREYRKKVGLYVQSGATKLGAVLFPYFLRNDEAVDKFIKKMIRPDGNVL